MMHVDVALGAIILVWLNDPPVVLTLGERGD